MAKINLRESLNKIDLATDNKYDLLNTFDSKKLSDENKKKLAEAIENNSIASINRVLHESEEQLYKVVISSGATKRNFESALYEDEAEGIVDYYGGRWIDENGFEWSMYVEEDDDSTEHAMVDDGQSFESLKEDYDEDVKKVKELITDVNSAFKIATNLIYFIDDDNSLSSLGYETLEMLKDVNKTKYRELLRSISSDIDEEDLRDYGAIDSGILDLLYDSHPIQEYIDSALNYILASKNSKKNDYIKKLAFNIINEVEEDELARFINDDLEDSSNIPFKNLKTSDSKSDDNIVYGIKVVFTEDTDDIKKGSWYIIGTGFEHIARDMTLIKDNRHLKNSHLKDKDFLKYYAYNTKEEAIKDAKNKSRYYQNGEDISIVEINLNDIDESLKESIDISDYEELHYPLRDGDKYYQLYRKIENGKGVWAAAELDKYGSDVVGEPFKITYEQARGFEPIEDSSIRKLSRDLGKKLLPKRENLNEAYRPLAIGYMILKKEIPNHVNYAEFANYDEVVTAIPSEADVVVYPRGGKISGTDIAYWQFDAIDLEGKKTKANFSTYIYSLKDFLNNDEMELKLIPDFKLIDEYPYLIEVDDNIDENMQESLNESSEPTEEDWNDFYKLEEDFANIMHSLNSDLDDAQANFYHDDFDGSIKITYRFVGIIENKNSKKTLNKIEKALESYLEKSKFSQYIEIDIYPMDSEILPPGIKNYEIMIKAETEPTKDPWKNESLKSCDTLEYDDKAKDKFGKSFDVADPQEVANTMKKYVKHNGKIYKPESLKEAIEDEEDFEYDDSDDVEEGNHVFADGEEYVWVERIAGPIYLNFDKWAVWSARVFVDPRDFMTIHSDGKNYDFDGDTFKEKAMAAPIVYFVVEEDTGFIDWGPVESRIEAQDFLNGKQEDWDNDEYYGESLEKNLDEWYAHTLHYEDIGDGREYDYEVDHEEVLDYLSEIAIDEEDAPEDTEEYLKWVEDNFDELFNKYEYEIEEHFREDASQEEYDRRHSSYEP